MISPLLKSPYTLDKLGTALTTEARGQVTQILPMEAGKTIGNSVMGQKRSGFLEFQERLFEELTVAFVWLYGVRLMDRWLDNLIAKRQKLGKLPVAYTQTDWSFGLLKQFMPSALQSKAKPQITLSALERFTHGHANAGHTLKIKAVKWALAVGVPLALCGYIIPKFNQWKTQWLVDTFYQKKSPTDNKPMSFREIRQMLGPFPMPTPVASFPMASPAYGYPQMPQAYPWPVPSAATMPVAWNAAPSRFGFSASPIGKLSPLGALGALVDNTTYGQILVIDTGITGGRMMVAASRSPYESLECLARDAGALVFYLKTVPWIIGGTDAILNKIGVQNVLEMDAQAMSEVNRFLVQSLQASGQDNLTQALTRQLAQVSQADVTRANRITTKLTPLLSRAETAAMKSAVQSHLRATTQTSDWGTQVLGHRVFQKSHISAQDLTEVLDDVMKQRGAFAQWDEAARYSVGKSLRMAFATESGLTQEALLKALKATTHVDSALEKQVLQATQHGANRLAATVLRESLNLGLMLQGHAMPNTQPAEALVRLAERATLEEGPLSRLMHDHLQRVLIQYQDFMAASGGHHPLKTPAAQDLTRLAQTLQTTLKAGRPVTATQLERFAEALAQNGRSGPRWLWFTKGAGLHALAEDVKGLIPLVKSNAPLASTFPELVSKQYQQWITHARQAKAPHVVRQLEAYQTRLMSILQGKGLFQLLASPSDADYAQAVEREMATLFQCNLSHNRVMVNRVMRTLGRQPLHAEGFFALQESQDVRAHMARYGRLLWKKLQAQSGPLTLSKLQDTMQQLRKTHLFQRYTTYGVALAASVWGIGIGLPKAIFWLTQRITGQNKHPGLASLNSKSL